MIAGRQYQQVIVVSAIALFLLVSCFCGPVRAQGDSPAEVTEPENVAGSPDPMVALFEQLDQTYLACNSLEKRERALEELRKLFEQHPDNYGLAWRAARMAWFVGDWLEDDQSDRLEVLGIEALKYADKALALNKDGLEGHYYKALAISTYSRGISIVKALMKGLSGDYVSNLAFVISRDEGYDHGGPLRAMGRYYWKLPWPKYDYKKSLEFLDRALKVDPQVLRTHYYRGDTLWALKKYQEARQEFEFAVKTPPSEFDEKDAPWVKKKAQEQLDKLLKERF